MLVEGLCFLSANPVDQAADIETARDMLRGFNTPNGVAVTCAEQIAERARELAASMSTTEITEVFSTTAPRVAGALNQRSDTVIDYFGCGTLPLQEAISIAVLEAVVHGLDLCNAVGAWPDTLPGAAVESTVVLLAELAPQFAFIEAATGRAPVDVLPLLH
jgi:hypothetical protein